MSTTEPTQKNKKVIWSINDTYIANFGIVANTKKEALEIAAHVYLNDNSHKTGSNAMGKVKGYVLTHMNTEVVEAFEIEE